MTTSPPATCVGPLTIPPDRFRTLRDLAAREGADEFAVFALCAAVLAGRLSPSREEPRRAHVVWDGGREDQTPHWSEGLDQTSTFRHALRCGPAPGGADQGETDQDHALPLDVTILISRDGRRVYVESRTDSADALTAQCWARSFLHLLGSVADHPDVPLREHRLMDDAERERILVGLNPYQKPEIRHRSMAEPFQEQARRTPGAVALVGPDGATVTYRDLNERANRLAHFLKRSGAGPDSRIGVCLERGVAQIVAVYAAVKTGAAYVPIDAELPDARLAYMLKDCAPTHVLTDRSCRSRVPEGPWLVHDVEADDAAWRACPATDPPVESSADGLLNILYTSGSTGLPKGVAYPVAGALAHLDWMQHRYPYGLGDAAVFKTSIGFDVSIWELFWPLYYGGRLVVCRPGEHSDPGRLAEIVAQHAVTTIFLAPTVMASFLEQVAAAPHRAGALRRALCGGEPVTTRIRDTFYTVLPNATLVNCYGPTEAGTVTDMALPDQPGTPVPLGRPQGHFRLLLLDEELEPVPVGMPGEAYIAGHTGLAQAYWRAPARTAERFVADPHGPAGARMYRTGDLCRYRDDGVLEHLGRIDRQIKIRGLRIEPGEIEAVLASHPTVENCAVLAHGTPTRLLAFVVTAYSTEAVAEYAASLLPEHMRPERVVPVAGIPATVNGKIDAEALLARWRELVEREQALVPPRDELERTLADIYADVLETSDVGMLDTFGRLGGDSLRAFQVLDQCQQRLNAKPDVAELLGGTVRDVAESIRAVLAEAGMETET